MQTAVVTGAAGFIGSHLVERLLADGWRVRGLDAFTDYYDPALKRSNLTVCGSHPDFELRETNLSTDDLEPLLSDATAVFHLAGQPGVRASWREGFAEYAQHNVVATQRLLEAARVCSVPRFVYSSSSSVYGRALRYPTLETDLPQPHSPYGVTKLAAEHLSSLYAHNFGLRTVSLRYFTVFGPRQRPDMAMHRLVESCLRGTAFPLYGDGSAMRDFTFVADVVDANLLAATADVAAGTVLNVAGGSEASLSAVISIIEELADRPVIIDQRDPQPGDVPRTSGSTERIRSELGWQPRVSLRHGLDQQVAWHRQRLERPGRSSS